MEDKKKVCYFCDDNLNNDIYLLKGRLACELCWTDQYVEGKTTLCKICKILTMHESDACCATCWDTRDDKYDWMRYGN